MGYHLTDDERAGVDEALDYLADVEAVAGEESFALGTAKLLRRIVDMACGTTGWNPDWASPPGETIQMMLDDRGGDTLGLRYRLDLGAEGFGYLMSGRLTIDEVLAARLSEALGGTPDFWLERERKYRATLLRLGN